MCIVAVCPQGCDQGTSMYPQGMVLGKDALAGLGWLGWVSFMGLSVGSPLACSWPHFWVFFCVCFCAAVSGLVFVSFLGLFLDLSLGLFL